jgi:hypothetical protein
MRKSKGISPEELVKREVLCWSFTKYWSLDVYDSKGTYSQSRGAYSKNIGMKSGTPDLIGCDNQGLAVYLELKKLGHRGSCRLSQRQFLERKIQANAFALVCDSVEYLESVYTEWISLRSISLEKAKSFLLEKLPNKVLINGKTISLIQES